MTYKKLFTFIFKSVTYALPLYTLNILLIFNKNMFEIDLEESYNKRYLTACSAFSLLLLICFSVFDGRSELNENQLTPVKVRTKVEFI